MSNLYPNSIRIGLMDPSIAQTWAQRILSDGTTVGSIKKGDTINHTTSQPIATGLFCQRIFGPCTDYTCACGHEKIRIGFNPNISPPVCPECRVEWTHASVRRQFLGSIELISPVTHKWFSDSRGAYIPTLLGITPRTFRNLKECKLFFPFRFQTYTHNSDPEGLNYKEHKNQKNNKKIKPTSTSYSNFSNLRAMHTLELLIDPKKSLNANWLLKMQLRRERPHEAKHVTSASTAQPIFLHKKEKFGLLALPSQQADFKPSFTQPISHLALSHQSRDWFHVVDKKIGEFSVNRWLAYLPASLANTKKLEQLEQKEKSKKVIASFLVGDSKLPTWRNFWILSNQFLDASLLAKISYLKTAFQTVLTRDKKISYPLSKISDVLFTSVNHFPAVLPSITTQESKKKVNKLAKIFEKNRTKSSTKNLIQGENFSSRSYAMSSANSIWPFTVNSIFKDKKTKLSSNFFSLIATTQWLTVEKKGSGFDNRQVLSAVSSIETRNSLRPSIATIKKLIFSQKKRKLLYNNNSSIFIEVFSEKNKNSELGLKTQAWLLTLNSIFNWRAAELIMNKQKALIKKEFSNKGINWLIESINSDRPLFLESYSADTQIAPIQKEYKTLIYVFVKLAFQNSKNPAKLANSSAKDSSAKLAIGIKEKNQTTDYSLAGGDNTGHIIGQEQNSIATKADSLVGLIGKFGRLSIATKADSLATNNITNHNHSNNKIQLFFDKEQKKTKIQKIENLLTPSKKTTIVNDQQKDKSYNINLNLKNKSGEKQKGPTILHVTDYIKGKKKQTTSTLIEVCKPLIFSRKQFTKIQSRRSTVFQSSFLMKKQSSFFKKEGDFSKISSQTLTVKSKYKIQFSGEVRLSLTYNKSFNLQLFKKMETQGESSCSVTLNESGKKSFLLSRSFNSDHNFPQRPSYTQPEDYRRQFFKFYGNNSCHKQTDIPIFRYRKDYKNNSENEENRKIQKRASLEQADVYFSSAKSYAKEQTIKKILSQTGGGALQTYLGLVNLSELVLILQNDLSEIAPRLDRSIVTRRVLFSIINNVSNTLNQVLVLTTKTVKSKKHNYSRDLLVAKPTAITGQTKSQLSTKTNLLQTSYLPTNQKITNYYADNSTFTNYSSLATTQKIEVLEKKCKHLKKEYKAVKKILCDFQNRKNKNKRRYKLAFQLLRTMSNPAGMTMSSVPVLPPGLRPIIDVPKIGPITADLNIRYRSLLFALRNLRELAYVDFRNAGAAQASVQEAVDDLLYTGGKTRREKQGSTANNLYKSLAMRLKGKHGRFRGNLLGKRVDYSGRSVIVVGPTLKIHQCGLPFEIAIKLFNPFLIRSLIQRGFCKNVYKAKQLLIGGKFKPLIWTLCQEVMSEHLVLLNRAPTLHRLGVQAFLPHLVSGRAILLHPLVCTGFNADFDGDQMGVHVPLFPQARAEAWKMMWSRNNFLLPSSGEPVLLPSQDMVLGCYYLTSCPPTSSTKDYDNRILVESHQGLQINSRLLSTRLFCLTKKDQKLSYIYPNMVETISWLGKRQLGLTASSRIPEMLNAINFSSNIRFNELKGKNSHNTKSLKENQKEIIQHQSMLYTTLYESHFSYQSYSKSKKQLSLVNNSRFSNYSYNKAKEHAISYTRVFNFKERQEILQNKQQSVLAFRFFGNPMFLAQKQLSFFSCNFSKIWVKERMSFWSYCSLKKHNAPFSKIGLATYSTSPRFSIKSKLLVKEKNNSKSFVNKQKFLNSGVDFDNSKLFKVRGLGTSYRLNRKVFSFYAYKKRKFVMDMAKSTVTPKIENQFIDYNKKKSFQILTIKTALNLYRKGNYSIQNIVWIQPNKILYKNYVAKDILDEKISINSWVPEIQRLESDGLPTTTLELRITPFGKLRLLHPSGIKTFAFQKLLLNNGDVKVPTFDTFVRTTIGRLIFNNLLEDIEHS